MKELAKKLLAIQQEMRPIVKDETNPFFKSKYFDINGLIAVLRPVISKHGVVVLQPLSHINGKPAIETVAIDSETGDAHSAITPIPEIADVQKMGAAITYYRRYALASMFLLEAEDDDGESAKPSTAKPAQAHTVAVQQATLGNCKSCGAPNKISQAGKTYCSNLCWKNAAPVLPTVHVDTREEWVPPEVE